jgi:hypothetical protein
MNPLISTTATMPDEAQNYVGEAKLRQLRDHHRFVLGLSVFVIVASFLLRQNDSDAVSIPGLGVNLPPLCASRQWLGIDCPGCGLTRSFIKLAEGDFAASFRQHRLGWFMALAVVAQIPYRWFALKQTNRKGLVERRWPMWFGWCLIGLLFVNWLLKTAGI